MLAVWWIFDMLFVWISPRSYEQYYLPLTASAAMLGGYICSLYSAKISVASNKAPWVGASAFLIMVMAVMVWPIFTGQSHSPHTGQEYIRTNPKTGDKENYKKYGFAQSLQRVKDSKDGRVGQWEVVGKYIGERTNKDDKIYVWGWVPGVYVKAQRLSPAKKAFESEMHVRSPRSLKNQVKGLVSSFEKEPPKYIVDSRKSHFPWYCPPLELWPTWPDRGFIQNKKTTIQQFDRDYSNYLARLIKNTLIKKNVSDEAARDKAARDEVARYEAMAPFRKFVMDNYTPVESKYYYKGAREYLHKMFGKHRVYKLKKDKPSK